MLPALIFREIPFCDRICKSIYTMILRHYSHTTLKFWEISMLFGEGSLVNSIISVCFSQEEFLS